MWRVKPSVYRYILGCGGDATEDEMARLETRECSARIDSDSRSDLVAFLASKDSFRERHTSINNLLMLDYCIVDD